MAEPPAHPPGHWVQCPECQRFFENEQGRGSHRLHAHGIRANGEGWQPAAPATFESAPSPPNTYALSPEVPKLIEPEPSPVEPTPQAEPTPAIDWSAPENVPLGLSTISQSLATARPRPDIGPLAKGVILCVILAFSGVCLYLLVKQFQGTNQPAPQPYVIDAARIQPGAPSLTTGDPYWDSLLGYRGLRL